MLKKTFPAIEFATLAITVFLMAANVAEGASSPSVALTGQVSSQEEGRMGGVLVSAKREGRYGHDHRGERRSGKVQLPNCEAGSRALCLAHSRGGL